MAICFTAALNIVFKMVKNYFLAFLAEDKSGFSLIMSSAFFTVSS